MRRQRYRLSDGMVTCKFCDRSFEMLHGSHLATHGATRLEYMEEFHLDSYQLISGALRIKMSRRSDYRPMRRRQLLQSVKAVVLKNPRKDTLFFTTNHYQLYSQASRQFRGWRAAVRAAGLETRVSAIQREWTRERVLSEIRRIHKETGSIALNRRESDMRVLHRAGVRHFGRWKLAVEAAGFDLKDFYIHGTWSKKDVLKRIKRARWRKNLSDREYFLLSRASKIHFDGMEKALYVAGFTWHEFFGTRRWSKEIVLSELKKFKSKYGRDCSGQIRKEAPDLYEASATYFGRWLTALEAAGIQLPHRRWTKALFKEEARKALTGKPTNIKYVYDHCSWLLHPAKKFYGSWPEAVEDAGLKWHNSRLWSREAVLEAVKGLAKTGSLLGQTAQADERLRSAVYYYFKNWSGAARAAGLDYESRVCSEWTKKRVIAEIRRLPRSPNGNIAVGAATANLPLYSASIRYFGSWKAAVDVVI